MYGIKAGGSLKRKNKGEMYSMGNVCTSFSSSPSHSLYIHHKITPVSGVAMHPSGYNGKGILNMFDKTLWIVLSAVVLYDHIMKERVRSDPIFGEKGNSISRE